MLRKHIASLSREQTSIWCSPMFKCRRRGTVSNCPTTSGSLAPCKADRRLRRSHYRGEHAARWESVLFEALRRTLHHRGDGTPAFERASALPYCMKWSGQTRSREIGSTASWLINGNFGQISDLGAVYRTSAFALRSRAAEGLSS